MDAAGNKRSRGTNYTIEEKDFLIDLVNRYKHILENKEVTSRAIFKKRQAWDDITNEFNKVATGGPRTWKQLRHLYDNIKTIARRKGYICPYKDANDRLMEKLDFKTADQTENDEEIIVNIDVPLGDYCIDDDDAELDDDVQDSKSDGNNVEFVELNGCQQNEVTNIAEDIDDDIEGNNEENVTSNSSNYLHNNIASEQKSKIDYETSYFKLKYENAKLERIHLLMKIRNEKLKRQYKKTKHDLEINILKQQCVKKGVNFNK